MTQSCSVTSQSIRTKDLPSFDEDKPRHISMGFTGRTSIYHRKSFVSKGTNLNAWNSVHVIGNHHQIAVVQTFTYPSPFCCVGCREVLLAQMHPAPVLQGALPIIVRPKHCWTGELSEVSTSVNAISIFKLRWFRIIGYKTGLSWTLRWIPVSLRLRSHGCLREVCSSVLNFRPVAARCIKRQPPQRSEVQIPFFAVILVIGDYSL